MRHQRGVSLVIALFLIVVVALLAAFAVTVGGSQRQSSTVSLMADRALAAARSGKEWAAYRALVNHVCPNQTLVLNEGALRGFRVNVKCDLHVELPANKHDYAITAEAQFGTYGSADYVSRTVYGRFSESP